MKILRPICAGLDVHKNVIVATLGITDMNTQITQYLQESFSTLNCDLYRLRDWLLDHHCHDVCMESTGKYWIPVFNILEDHLHVFLTHPKYVKAIKGKKTDKKDSKWICDLFKHDLVRFSFIPSKEIRALREIARYRFKLVCMRSSERNRFQNSMTVSNVALASALSDPFGKTATAIMHEILSNSSAANDEDRIRKLIHRSCKNKNLIVESVKDCRMESDQKFKMTTCFSHLEELDRHIAACEIELFTRAAPFLDLCLLLTAIPGIQLLSAILILSEIGNDMSLFSSSKQLVSWAGLAPANNESAGKKKSVRISKAGQYLKPLRVQCSLASIKNPDSYFGKKYSRIKKRRGHKKAIIAIARMILVCIYHMLLTGESFHPCDYDELMNPKVSTSTVKFTDVEAIEHLRLSGYDVSSLFKLPSSA